MFESVCLIVEVVVVLYVCVLSLLKVIYQCLGQRKKNSLGVFYSEEKNHYSVP